MARSPKTLQDDLREAVHAYAEATLRETEIIRLEQIMEIAAIIILQRTQRDSITLSAEQKKFLSEALATGLPQEEETAMQHLNDAISEITFKIGLKPNRGNPRSGR